MGCTPSVNIVLIQEQLEFCNLKCVFTQERKEADLLHKPSSYFSKQFSPTIGIVGTAFSIYKGVADYLIEMIQQTFESNLYFENEQYLEGFENSAEIIASFFKPGLQFDKLFQKAEAAYPHPLFISMYFSVNCMMKIDDRLYFMKIPSLTPQPKTRIMKPTPYYKYENEAEFVPNFVDDFQDISDFVSELKPDLAKKVSRITLTDEKLSINQAHEDQRRQYTLIRRYQESTHLQLIHIFLSDEEYGQFIDV